MTIRFQATFGMFEMEVAAAKIVGKAEAAGSWNIGVSLDDFEDGSECLDDFSKRAARTGFLHLISNGWLEPNLLFKSEFCVRQEFINRVKHKIIINLEPLRI